MNRKSKTYIAEILGIILPLLLGVAFLVIIVCRTGIIHIYAGLCNILLRFFLSFYPLIFLIVLWMGLLLLFFYMGWVDFLQVLLSKVGFSLGGRALTSALLKLGLAGGLASAIGLLARVLISGEISEIVALEQALGSDSLSGTATSDSSTTILVGSSHTNSVGQENPAEEPPLLSHFGGIFPQGEIDLYARIRLLEARELDLLPPQETKGEYEALVRQNLNQALTAPHYLSIFETEVFDLSVLELKGDLVDRLFNLLLSEPDLRNLLRASPFSNIRAEALEFLTCKLERFGQPDPFPRSPTDQILMDGFLRFVLSDLQQRGPNSPFYAEFLSYFRNGGGSG